MRSLVGLAAVVAAASLYLYTLSLYLPAGPRRRPQPGPAAQHVEGRESEQSSDTSGELSRPNWPAINHHVHQWVYHLYSMVPFIGPLQIGRNTRRAAVFGDALTQIILLPNISHLLTSARMKP
ncbi:hypothetical protein XENORESO_012181 [Xenotaenia resolanae]|uniref:Mannosyltransferase n=1 Tax=Xenotaenia resolanae TaxID=208358 RepID=A0ABV0VZA3_9TELE